MTFMAAPVSASTRVALDELISLAALAHGASLARSRRSPALRSGGNTSRWRGRGVDFRESRIYQPGDEIRHMDWRVTARSGKPHTKLFEEEREQGLLLALDLNPGMRFGTRVRFKSVQAARAAALLAWMASAAGDRVGALGFGGGIDGEVKPAGGRRGVLRVLRALRDWDTAADAATQESLGRGLSRVRRLLRPGMRLVLLTDGFSTDAEAARLMPQLAGRHDIAVVVLRDALELSAPPPGRYALHLGPTRRVLDFSDGKVRSAWAERFATSREQLRNLCAKLGIRVLELDGHADLRRALGPLLARSLHSPVVT
ncbi:DUF58 domain-containing protein [Dokdonella ginsengisoli]|uniref:DUF58 domain-containing protein n=2 Tax=Dokdonella ginsengisoli TaxID=363846 RepID=A0ABV9QXS1_9GAMM